MIVTTYVGHIDLVEVYFVKNSFGWEVGLAVLFGVDGCLKHYLARYSLIQEL